MSSLKSSLLFVGLAACLQMVSSLAINDQCEHVADVILEQCSSKVSKGELKNDSDDYYYCLCDSLKLTKDCMVCSLS
jgi:hypothetical protein